MRRLTWSPIFAVSAILASLLSLTAIIVGLSLATASEMPEMASIWKNHRKICLNIPEESFRKDQSRALRGIVRDASGKPVAGSLVRCLPLAALREFIQRAPQTPMLWSGLVEAETRTDSDGKYEFPHLAEGSRTVCASASGLAPDVQCAIVILDGTGARVDFNLEAPKKLRVSLKDVGDRSRRVHIVPYRWWPEFPSRDVTSHETQVEFPDLGGPFRKGIVCISESDSPSRWEPKAAFDLDRSHEVTVSCIGGPIPSALEVPEAGCLPPWQPKMSGATRLFFSMLTPTALLWQTDSSPEPTAVTSAGVDATRRRGNSELRGYASGPFLPVLIESRDGGAWLDWTSDASEFDLVGIPGGVYRVRSLSSFGRVSYARGLVVPPSGIADLDSRFDSRIEVDEPLSREVMGIVRWENGLPAEGAEVFLQDAANFRRFLQRAVADRSGYFRIPNVPGGARYVAFAMPPKVGHAIKHYVYLHIDQAQRETWLDFSLSPHHIVGQFASGESKRQIQLIREDPGGQKRLVWSVASTKEGQFEFANVLHGRYVVHAVGEGSLGSRASVPFVVEADEKVVVRWAEP